VRRFRGAVSTTGAKLSLHPKPLGEGLQPFTLTNAERSEAFALIFHYPQSLAYIEHSTFRSLPNEHMTPFREG